ncbi:MAG: bifunctional phosphoribosyl-AMP cyclohydrolase/phosphoribosyl-ATP pyrophosphatase, partial [Lachnospiraceae bacterium]
MEHKNLIATMYLKNGMAVIGNNNFESAGDLKYLARLYNDSGIDKLYVFDLSEDDNEHDLNLHT